MLRSAGDDRRERGDGEPAGPEEDPRRRRQRNLPAAARRRAARRGLRGRPGALRRGSAGAARGAAGRLHPARSDDAGHRRPRDLPAHQASCRSCATFPIIMLTAVEDRDAMIEGLERGRRRLHRQVERVRGGARARARADPAQAVRGREPAHPRAAAARRARGRRGARGAGARPRRARRWSTSSNSRTRSWKRSATRCRTTCARRCAASTASAWPCSRTTATSSTTRAGDICSYVRDSAQQMARADRRPAGAVARHPRRIASAAKRRCERAGHGVSSPRLQRRSPSARSRSSWPTGSSPTATTGC